MKWNSIRGRRSGWAGALAVLVAAVRPAAAQRYAVTELPLGANRSYAMGVNTKGQVVGTTNTPDGGQCPFLYDSSGVRNLGTLGGTDGQALAINDAGQIAGYSLTASNRTQHAFLWTGGSLHDLTPPGGSLSSGWAMNAAGHVVGDAYLPGNTTPHAFLCDGAGMHDLGTLGGGTNSAAFGVNGSDEVVGNSATGGNTNGHAFLYNEGSMHDLGTLGGTFSTALGINDAGQIVGHSYLAGDTTPHGFLYDTNGMHDLGTLGGSASWALAINSRGEIIGEAKIAGNTVDHAFIWKNGVMADLNCLIPPNSGWMLYASRGIADNGLIVGEGFHNGVVANFLLTPVDTTPPTLVCPAAITRPRDKGKNYASVAITSPSASDDSGSVTVTGKRSDGKALTAPYPIGRSTITWIATDPAGNAATCRQRVTVTKR